MKPCNVVNCILRITCPLNLLAGYVCFDICGGIKRASSRGHRARMQFPQTISPWCDKQIIASALGELRINFACIFKVFPKFLGKIRVKLTLNCPRAHAVTCIRDLTIRQRRHPWKRPWKTDSASFQTISRLSNDVSKAARLLKRREFMLELKRGGHARVQTEIVEFIALPLQSSKKN